MILLVKYGEIILKGQNRSIFEKRLIQNIKRTIGDEYKLYSQQAVTYIKTSDEEGREIAVKVSKVFGVASVCLAYEVEKDIDKICEKAVDISKDLKGTFKIEAKRADKKFPYKSPEICQIVGSKIYLEVDVNNPNYIIDIEIREDMAFVYYEKIKGIGGLPTGSSGKAALLISGGIDSPVAGYMIGKRGVLLHAVHFFSYPYTSLRAKEKVINLLKIVGRYTGRIQLHVVPFTEIQLEINKNCPADEMTIIMRRFMMQIATDIAEKNGCEALVTGESLAQVASQTIQGIGVTNEATALPVFRPLIGMDKEEIIEVAREIDTYETSILPFEDCCTVFTPKHPVTKPKLNRIKASQSKLDCDNLIQNALKGVETICIN